MNRSYLSDDMLDMAESFNRHQVDYVLVGGYAVIFYGYVRVTGDVDFFVRPAKENFAKLFSALMSFWGGAPPGISSPDDFQRPNTVVQFGQPPNRIDILTGIEGITFDEASRGKQVLIVTHNGNNLEIPVIGLEGLKKNKAAVNRLKDQNDLEFLKKLKV